jgi:hypothetical protein
MIVRTFHSVLSIQSTGRVVLLCVGLGSLVLSGCGLFSSRDGLGSGYYLPLTVQLRNAPSVAAAQVTYQDACGQVQTLSLGKPLTEAITRKSGRVFEKVITDGAGATAIDGYEDVSVGLIKLDLAIPRKVTKSYPVTLAIGLDFAYTAADGTVLYNKKLQSLGRGEVDVTASSCEVKGLDKIAEVAITNVTDGMAKQLGTSNKIRARKSGAPPAAGGAPASPIASASAAAAAPTATSPSSANTTGSLPDQPATLVFRAIIRDENRNQLLHQGELISIEIEIKNEGPGRATGVEILVSAPAALVDTIPGVLSVGDLTPGDVKRLSVDGKVGVVAEATMAELALALRAKSTTVQLPSVKKFLVTMVPATAPDAAMAPVDVDELPKVPGKLKQPKAVGIAIGIGQFRENGMQRVKFAHQDADMMAMYWGVVGGVPRERIRRLFDNRALKSDLVETFEEWLPAQIDPTTVVYVFIAGRGVVEPATGAVSVIPFDGTTTSGGRLYSLRRLQEALIKLPIQRAIVMVDLSLEHAPEKDASAQAAPIWPQEERGKERIMWMVGNRAVQEAHYFDLGQHGLFTYQLLRGLSGAADVDKDGTILAGELCTYTKGQVLKMAREQFGNEQEPLCVPGPGQGAMVRLQPVAKLK